MAALWLQLVLLPPAQLLPILVQIFVFQRTAKTNDTKMGPKHSHLFWTPTISIPHHRMDNTDDINRGERIVVRQHRRRGDGRDDGILAAADSWNDIAGWCNHWNTHRVTVPFHDKGDGDISQILSDPSSLLVE